MLRIFISFFLIGLVLGGLVGCGHTQTLPGSAKTIYLPIPTEFTKLCKIEKPLDKDSYLKLNAKEKEEVLYKLNRANLLNLAECNHQIQKLKEWDQQQDQIFNGAQDGQKKNE